MRTDQDDPDEGMEGSVRLGIPEPMIFDLVRPLGATKGEFEVNSLFRHTLRAGEQNQWAPEVEYAFLNGTAVEFELPMAGTTVQDYKVALQQTLPTKAKRFTHGVQGIGEVARGESAWEATGVYIAGVRWHERWSTLSMAGVSHARKSGKRTTSPLVNHSLFHERWKRAAIGLEVNLKDPLRRHNEWLVMPQVHIRVYERINLQIGTGYTKRSGQSAPVIAWRLIREL